ncbi:MAG: putative bifunctional diguanylate cyclase/phosphodiesterase [Colwellia sp.]
MNILIVDDDIVDRTHVKRTLRRNHSHYNVFEAEDAFAALEIIKEQVFDVIIVDFNMPKINGLELVHLIKRENIIGNSAIIMISTSEEETLALECLQAGVQDFIAKTDINGFRLRRAILSAKTRLDMEKKLNKSYLQVKKLAEQDSLTQLSNRYVFDNVLKRSIENSYQNEDKTALILFDLDHFKYVNDTYGHDVGDKLLQMVVKRVKKCLRGEEVFARLGGDEFAIIVRHLHEIKHLQSIARRVLESFSETFYINQTVVSMSASIGGAIYPDNANDAESIYKCADLAMYKSKHTGRNTVTFYEDKLQLTESKRLPIEIKLKTALQNNEFELNYQAMYVGNPIKVYGFEALIRWQNSEGTIVTPDEFIPIAEETRLIIPIGRWIIEEAIKQLSVWHEEVGNKLCISINLSPVQLLDENIISHIKFCLKKFAVEAKFIEFELTETALLVNSQDMRSTIDKISELGCTIALDDFGTGFSSISHLHDFPINTVKIDKSLMPQKNERGFNYKLIHGLVSMLQYLQLNTVAEGIEEQRHLSFCQSLQVNRFQGYYLQKPLPGKDISLKDYELKDE